MKRTLLLTAALASAIGLAAVQAHAQQQGLAVETQERMSIAQIAALLEGQGYRVLEIELEHEGYDVEMIDANGMRVEATLDPVSGAVLPYRDDDRYDDRRDG